MNDNDKISHDETLHPGDVAVVFRANGEIQISHNIESVRDTNHIDGAKDGAPFLMAIACLSMIESEADWDRFLSEAARRVAGMNMPLSKTMN